MMYHSVHSQRYGRAKGMKVKHLVQLVVLTVLFTWFMYQLNISHKAKVRALRVKEDDIDDELLISDDHGGIDRAAVDHDEIMAGEVAQDEFIDRKSVLKSRKLSPDLTDTPELEQTIAEGDRAEAIPEDVLDDSGEGDRDERVANYDDRFRRTRETDLETNGEEKGSVLGERHRSFPYYRATEAAEDRGDGDDEVQAEMSTGKEFDGAESLAAALNLTQTVEDDTLIYTNGEDSNVESIDVSEVETPANPMETGTDHKELRDEARLAGFKSPESTVLSLRTPGDVFPKLDDGAMDHLDGGDDTKSRGIATPNPSEQTEADKNPQNGEMTTTPSDAKPRSKSDEIALVEKGRSKESKLTGKMNSTSSLKVDEGIGFSPVPLQSGADPKQEQGRGAGDKVDLLEDGHVSEVIKQDKPFQQEAILEAVPAIKQDKPGDKVDLLEDGHVSEVIKQDKPVQQEAILEAVPAIKQDKPVQQEAILEVVPAIKQEQRA